MLRSPRRWSYSIKNYRKASGAAFGRSRLYWETEADDFYSAMWGANDPVDWQAAEVRRFWLKLGRILVDLWPVLTEHWRCFGQDLDPVCPTLWFRLR